MISKFRNVASAIYQQRDAAVRANLFNSELLIRTILADSRYKSDKNLSRYTFKSYSQFGEDGILNEIFRRIGTTNRFFVEFGVGNGMENNTCHQLVVNVWDGLWIEGSGSFVSNINRSFQVYLEKGKLKLIHSFVTAENIEKLFAQAGVPHTFDLLSIDIDGNDYHVWRAIQNYRPRVVVVEYNASFGAVSNKVMPYDPDYVWNGSNLFGASLKAFEELGAEKSYSLVACDIAGINAFFVRTELLEDHFQGPFSSENHFEPPRYFLHYFGGHPAQV